MNTEGSPEIDSTINGLRAELDALYQLIDSATQTLAAADRSTVGIRQTVDELGAAVGAAQKALSPYVKSIDDSATIMQRELSHLSDGNLEGAPRSVTVLLRLTVRLAATIFSVERLRDLERADASAQNIDALRSGWQRWLVDLQAYLAEALPLARRLVATDGGPMAQSYNATLETLALLGRSSEPAPMSAPPLLEQQSQTEDGTEPGPLCASTDVALTEGCASQVVPSLKEEDRDGSTI